MKVSLVYVKVRKLKIDLTLIKSTLLGRWAWQATFERRFICAFYTRNFLPNFVTLAFIATEFGVFILTDSDGSIDLARIYILRGIAILPTARYTYFHKVDIPFLNAIQCSKGIHIFIGIFAEFIILIQNKYDKCLIKIYFLEKRLVNVKYFFIIQYLETFDTA